LVKLRIKAPDELLQTLIAASIAAPGSLPDLVLLDSESCRTLKMPTCWLR
jgi:hypothetical protein